MMLSAVRPCTCMTWELSLVELSPHIPETGGPCTLPLYPVSIGRLHLHLHQIPDQSSYTKSGNRTKSASKSRRTLHCWGQLRVLACGNNDCNERAKA
jgi:hypothetical protein